MKKSFDGLTIIKSFILRHRFKSKFKRVGNSIIRFNILINKKCPNSFENELHFCTEYL